MKKIRIKDTTNEMSTTGTGASFTSGQGGQYASPKAFKIKRNKKLAEEFKVGDQVTYLGHPGEITKVNKEMTGAISYNVSYDKGTGKTKASNIFNKGGEIKALAENIKEGPGGQIMPGDIVKNQHGDHYMRVDGKVGRHDAYVRVINGKPGKKKTGLHNSFKLTLVNKEGINSPFDHASPSIPNRPSKAIDYKQLFEDPFKVGDITTKRGVKTTVRDVDPETGAVAWKVEYVPAFDSTFKEFQELNKFIKTLAQKTEDTTIDSIADQVTKLFNQYRTHIRKNYPDSYKKYASNPTLEHESLNEARYSQFKKQTEVTTPTQQIHRAVREIRRKIDEITKVVGHTERMKTELKSSNEGMSYLKRTKNAISKISEKIQELNNRIKGLTE